MRRLRVFEMPKTFLFWPMTHWHGLLLYSIPYPGYPMYPIPYPSYPMYPIPLPWLPWGLG